MIYVDVYTATRAIMRLMSGGKVTAGLRDLVGDPVFELALDVLTRAIKSPIVKITVAAADGGRREIEDDERSFRLDFWTGELADPFGGAPLRKLLICEEGLARIVASKDEPPGQAPAQAVEPVRFPGRPSVGRQILDKMRARFAIGEESGRVADEARWLMLWAQNEFPKDASVPTKPTSVENTIRKEFRRLKEGRAVAAE